MRKNVLEEEYHFEATIQETLVRRKKKKKKLREIGLYFEAFENNTQ
jgi:hypothetical protein